jgi:predicted RNase H-like HicB family nuclease
MTLNLTLEKSEERAFTVTVYVPSLPGCISEGDTREEALENIREAIELYLEPTDDDLFLTESKEMESDEEFPLSRSFLPLPLMGGVGKGDRFRQTQILWLS